LRPIAPFNDGTRGGTRRTVGRYQRDHPYRNQVMARRDPSLRELEPEIPRSLRTWHHSNTGLSRTFRPIESAFREHVFAELGTPLSAPAC
jgi:hypothetical protein